MTTERIVLLFVHGGGFTKESWNPIIRRLKASQLLQRVPCEIVASDLPWHGSRSDHSVPGRVIEPEDTDAGMTEPNVEHPTREWPVWAVEEMRCLVQKLRHDDAALCRRTRVVGIAHSMGAAAVLKVETTSPGTFDGLIAFEPICNGDMAPERTAELRVLMTVNTLYRKGEWESMDEVVRYFHETRPFSRWDREALNAHVHSCVRLMEDGKYRLALTPVQEAALYVHEIMGFTVDDFARAQCKLFFEHGEFSPLFIPDAFQDVADVLHGRCFLGEPIRRAGHAMLMEKPEECARHILADLARIPVIQARAQASKL